MEDQRDNCIHAEPDDEPATRIGRSVLRLARAVVAVIDSVATVLSAARELTRDVADVLHSDWRGENWSVRGATAALGTTVASTGGFGIQPFAAHESLSVLAAAPFWMPAIWKWFDYLSRDSERGWQRAQVEGAVLPDLDVQLAEEERKRAEAAARCGRKLSPPLEQRRFVPDVLAHSRNVVNAMPAAPTVSYFLVRQVGRSSYKVVATRGPIEDEFKAGAAWTADEVFRRGDAFVDLLKPFQYRRSVVAFQLADCQYFLVAIAGTEIPDAVVLRVSATATQLVLLTAMDVAGEDWKSLIAAGGLK